MNLKPFTVGTTNIFPLVNSKAGGQLCTEFNLRSRETVYSDSTIEYSSGPSFTHSLRDFKVDVISGSNSTISISRGMAIVNGHYVESLVDFEIDMQGANLAADPADRIPDGRVAIGLQALYSTQPTIAGAMQAENTTGVYEGVQVVILPVASFKTPLDSPADESAVTAHLKLAEFTFTGGIVSNVTDNTARVQAFSADRIGSVDAIISDEYIKRTNLNTEQLYVLSGKGSSSDEHKQMDWCVATGSLMMWDGNPQLVSSATSDLPTLPGESSFKYNGLTDTTSLQMPHKQPDIALFDHDGHRRYYPVKEIKLPNASFAGNKGGVVTQSYNKYITDLKGEMELLKVLPNGKMLRYIPILESRSSLPVLGTDILDATIGDYILVREDQTTGAVAGSYPVTMYVVIPVEQTGIDRTYTFTQTTPTGGVRFGEQISETDPTLVDDYHYDATDPGSATSIQAVKDYCVDSQVPGIAGNNYVEVVPANRGTSSTVITDGGSQAPTINGSVIPTSSLDDGDVVQYNDEFFQWSTSTSMWTQIPSSYYVIDPIVEKTYSDPLIISATISPATTTTLGGFLSIDQDQTGYGYVYIDEDNHLRLVDFDLLASGVLAYQLGEDFKTGAGADIATINEQLIQYVNERVAFPTVEHSQNAANPSVITVTITLPDEVDEDSHLYIYGIDSRFTTSVTLQFVGASSSNLTIHIADCERIKIEMPAGFLPKVKLYRCNLYYDADVLNALNSVEGLKLWYERRSLTDPEIAVDGMKVYRLTSPSVVQSENYWSGQQIGDSHYKYALQSITFSDTGYIIDCELLVTDDISAAANVSETTPVTNIGAFDFTLPSDIGFTYPANCLTKQLKVGGQFITAFAASGSDTAYILKNTSFTAVSQYTEVIDDTPVAHTGMISFYTVISKVDSITGAPSSHEELPSWETGKFYKFSGGVVD